VRSFGEEREPQILKTKPSKHANDFFLERFDRASKPIKKELSTMLVTKYLFVVLLLGLGESGGIEGNGGEKSYH